MKSYKLTTKGEYMANKDFSDKVLELLMLIKDDDSEHPTLNLPCIPTRGVVVFPASQSVFEIGRKKSVFSVKKAAAAKGFVFLTAQRDEELERPSAKEELFEIGFFHR